MKMQPSRGHRTGRLPHGLFPALFLLAAAVLATGLLLGPAGAARADATALAKDDANKVTVFESTIIGADEVRDTVVVVGGNLTVHGTVRNVAVVVGGDLHIASDGRVGVGPGRSSGDAAYVAVFGHVTIDPGAEVAGRRVNVASSGSGALHALVTDPVMHPWNNWGSIGGWIGSTVFIVIIAVIAAAIAPRQLAFVSDRARKHLWSSLGWGALGVVGTVVTSVLLIITVIGIIVLVPWWLLVLVVSLFGYVGVGALIGRLILGRNDNRGPVMLAAVLGVVVLSIVRWIPVAGSIVTFLAGLVGLGAAVTGFWEWRRRARVHPGTMPPPAYGPAGPYGGPGNYPSPPYDAPPAGGHQPPPAVADQPPAGSEQPPAAAPPEG